MRPHACSSDVVSGIAPTITRSYSSRLRPRRLLKTVGNLPLELVLGLHGLSGSVRRASMSVTHPSS
jgi:hypothetical protein